MLHLIVLYGLGGQHRRAGAVQVNGSIRWRGVAEIQQTRLPLLPLGNVFGAGGGKAINKLIRAWWAVAKARS